jgi:hypothetical protein
MIRNNQVPIPEASPILWCTNTVAFSREARRHRDGTAHLLTGGYELVLARTNRDGARGHPREQLVCASTYRTSSQRLQLFDSDFHLSSCFGTTPPPRMYQ